MRSIKLKSISLIVICLVLFSERSAKATLGTIKWISSAEETGDTSLLTAVTQTNGTFTSDTSQSFTGPRSFKSDVTVDGGTARASATVGTCADTGCYTSFYFRISAIPAATSIFLVCANAAGTGLYNLAIQSNGILRQPTINGITGKNGSTTLVINTWYRISVGYKIVDTTHYDFRVYVNGTLEISTTQADGTLSAVTTSRFQYGNAGGRITTMWFDNLYVDDHADFTDTGNIFVTAKHPAALNVNNFDTAVGANPVNRWTNVNEVPLSTTNGWSEAATADVQENYTLETAAAGDVNINGTTILGRMAWIWAKGTAGGAGTPKIMDNGTEAAVVLTNAYAGYYVFTTSSAYPNNSAGIGMRSTNNADDTFLAECGTSIAYQAGIAGQGGHLMTLGIGK